MTGKANKNVSDWKRITRVWVGKNLCDMFPIRNGLKQGDALFSLHYNFALEYAIRRVQVNQDNLKLNCTHQLLVYADDVNPLNAELNPTCHLLALLGAHPVLHISRIKVNVLEKKHTYYNGKCRS